MRILAFTALLIVIAPSFAQEDAKKPSVSKQHKEDAHRYINELRNGALLVRLSTAQHKSQALRDQGMEQEARDAEKEVEMRNKVLITAFRKHFSFSPVYFFFPEHSGQVSRGSLDSVTFVDQELLADTSSPATGTEFFTAEIGMITQDTTKIFEGYYYHQGENGLERRERYSGGSGITFEALVMKNHEFIQLTDPFPYYVRTYGDLPVGQDYLKIVKKLDKRLWKFYKKNMEISNEK